MNHALNYPRIERAVIYLKENYLCQPSLEECARHCSLSKFHFKRLFENWAGVSPKTFVQFLTVQHAKKLLAAGQSTLQTSYEVGLSGTGRLHDAFIKIESVSPGQFKSKGRDLQIIFGFYPSIFGDVLIAETHKGICALNFVYNKKQAIKELKQQWQYAKLLEQKGEQALKVYVYLNKLEFPKKTISLNLCGTEFQIKVWEALLRIPQGRLASYGDIARLAGKPRAARAVGSAIGKNPIALLIPCHRVIGESGEIGQYRWGCARKSSMIAWESAHQR